MRTNRKYLAKISDTEILQTAWQKIKAKRKQGGIDKVTIEDFTANSEKELENLRVELITERYTPEPLKIISIPKTSDSPEKRQIGLASIRDKVAQEAVRLVVEPEIERLFLNCSYGYRRGKGTGKAIRRVSHYIKARKCNWVVSADIDNYFNSINQETLLNQFRRIIPEEAIVRLIGLWLKMGTIDFRGTWNNAHSGIYLGNGISPLLSNLYLHQFDEIMTAQNNFGLVRYADDMVVMCKNRRQAETALETIKDFLANRLDLKLNPNPLPISNVKNGFSFLGIYFRGNKRFIEFSRFNRLRRKLQSLNNFETAEGFTDILREFNETVVGWRNYYGKLIIESALIQADEIFSEQLAEIISTTFQKKLFKTKEEAEKKIKYLEFLIIKDISERKDSLAKIVQKGFSLAKEIKETKLAVNKKIRRKKQKHYRQTSLISNLFVNTPGTFLGKSAGNLFIRQKRRKVREILLSNLSSVTLLSRGISLSSDLITHCAAKDIPLIFSSPHGKLEAILTAPNSINSNIGLLQLEALSKEEKAFELARAFVRGKIRNQMNLMKYFHKYRKNTDKEFSESFSEYIKCADKSLIELKNLNNREILEKTRQSLYGIEGSSAKDYWNLFGLMVGKRAEFTGRIRRGATDLVNSMLNYGYAILQSRIYLAIIKAGLTPQISFLHAARRGKPTLAFDIIEEFRPSVVDRSVITMFNRNEPASLDEDGNLTIETRQRLISRVQIRLATILNFRKKELKIDEIIFHQTQGLVRHLQSQSKYKPFIEKW